MFRENFVFRENQYIHRNPEIEIEVLLRIFDIQKESYLLEKVMIKC